MKLDNYHSTEELKNLDNNELIELSDSIREEIISHIERHGGHLGSNLAIIELTISLLKNFDPSKFRYLYDTGYQSYAFKMLTDRKEFLEELERSTKFSIFQEIQESKLDHYSGGHTSVSSLWAAGYNHILDGEQVIEIIGDGSLATSLGLGGMLNFFSNQHKGLFILNDNKQGIGLNKFNYLDWKQIAQGMGYAYFEVNNGHDFHQLQAAWDFYKNQQKSVFVKVNTIKANKYSKIKDANEVKHYHTLAYEAPENLVNPIKIINSYIEEALKNKDTYLVLPGMVYTFGMADLESRYPNQVIDTGIAEEISVIEAAALAAAGKKVYMIVYSTFFQRCYDQIVHDVMRNNSNINIIIVGSNITSIGDSHHGIYDLNMYNGFENVKVFNPSNSKDLLLSLNLAEKYNGPSFIRLGNEIIKSENNNNLELEKWNYAINKDNQNLLISYGDGFINLEKFINENNINIDLVEAKTLNPIDIELIANLIKKGKKLYTYEISFWKNNLASTIRTKFKDLIIKDFAFNKLQIGRGDLKDLFKENHMDLEFVTKEILKDK